MQDQPSAEELLEAVGAYLFEELRPQVPKQERFKVLVAANVCAVAARELRAGTEHDAADLALFSELIEAADGSAADADRVGAVRDLAAIRGNIPDVDLGEEAREAAAELTPMIRSGRLDEQLPVVIDGLTQHVRRKLEIARPGYAD